MLLMYLSKPSNWNFPYLSELCTDAVCRFLPNLNGELPSGRPNYSKSSFPFVHPLNTKRSHAECCKLIVVVQLSYNVKDNVMDCNL